MWQALDKVTERWGQQLLNPLGRPTKTSEPDHVTEPNGCSVEAARAHHAEDERTPGQWGRNAKRCQLLGHGTATGHASHPSAWLPRAPGGNLTLLPCLPRAPLGNPLQVPCHCLQPSAPALRGAWATQGTSGFFHLSSNHPIGGCPAFRIKPFLLSPSESRSRPGPS